MDSKEDKISAGMTPVSILYQKLGKTGRRPIFELIYDSTSRPTCINNFTFRVKVGDIEQYGTATTKKAAKQAAAKAMLMAISENEDIKMLKKLQEHKNEKEDTFVNHVGNLMTFCSRNKLPKPFYDEDIDDDRPSHDMQFYCKCIVGKRDEIGASTTKRGAKHSAAQAMYARLIKEIEQPNDPYVPDYKLNNDDQFVKAEKYDPWPDNDAPWTNDDYDSYDTRSRQVSPNPSDINDEDYEERKTKLRLLELPNFEALGVPISPHGSETSASEREAITSEYGDSVIDSEDTKEKKTKLKLLDLGDRDIVNLPQTSEYNQTLTDNQQPIDYEQVQETKPKIRIANFGSNFENTNLNAQTPVDSDPSRLVSFKAESLNEAERQYFTENNGAPVDSAEVEEEQEERKTKLRLLELDNFDIAGNNSQSSAYISNETNIEQPQNATALNIENYEDYDLEADVKPIIKTEVKKKQNLNSSLQSTRLSAVNSGVIISLIPDIKSSHHFLGSLSDSEEEEAQLSTLITSQGQKYWPAAMDDYADKDSMQQTKYIDNLKNRTQETCATGKYFKDDGDDEKMNCCNTIMVYDNDKEKSENNVKYETKFHSMKPSKYFTFPKMRCLTRISETVSGYERVEYELGDERVLATVRRLTEAFLLEEPTITAIKEDEDSDINNNCISKINDKLYGTMMYEKIMNYGKTGDKLAIRTDSIAPVNKRISGGRFHDNKPNIGKTARRGAAKEKHNDATDSGYRRGSNKIGNEGEIKQENAAANQNSPMRSISGAMECKKEHNNDDNKSNNQDRSQDSRDKGSNKKNNDKRKNSKENNSSNNEQKMEEKKSNAMLRSDSMKKENLYCPFEIDLVSESEEDIVDSNGTDIEESSDEWQIEEEFRHPRLDCPIRTEVLKLPFEIETINIDDGVEMDATSMTSSQEEALLRDDNDDLGNVPEVIVDKRFAGINMNPRIVLTRCDEKLRIKSPGFIDLSKSPINNHDIDQKVGGIKEGTTFSDRVIDISIKEEIQELMDMVAEDEARKSVSPLESTSVQPVQLNEQSGADLQHEAPKVDEMKLPQKKARIFKVKSPKLEVRELLEEPRPDTRIFKVDSGEKEVTELLEKAEGEAQALKVDCQTSKATELPEKPVREATVFKIDSKVSNIEVSQAGATALDAGAPNAEQVQRPRGLARVFKVDSIDDKQLRRKLPGLFRARCGALQPTIIPELDIKKEIPDESELSSEKSEPPTASKPQEMDIKTEITEDNRDVPTVAKPLQRTVRIIHKSELFQKRRRRLTRVSSNCPMSKNMETLAANVSNAGPSKVSQNPGADMAIVVKKEIPFDEVPDNSLNVNLGAVPMNYDVTLPPPAHAHIPRSDTTGTVVEPMEIPEALDLSVSKPKESLKTPDEALTEKGMTGINPEILLTAENLRKRTRRRRVINQPSIPLAPVEKPQIPFVNSGQKRISEYFEFVLSHGVDLRKSAIERICKLVDHMARLDVANDPRIIEGAIASMNEILETLDINFCRFCVVTHDGHYVSVIHVDSISEIVEVTKHPNVHEAHKSTFFKALKKVNQLLL